MLYIMVSLCALCALRGKRISSTLLFTILIIIAAVVDVVSYTIDD
jgi:hypothetical protein